MEDRRSLRIETVMAEMQLRARRAHRPAFSRFVETSETAKEMMQQTEELAPDALPPPDLERPNQKPSE